MPGDAKVTLTTSCRHQSVIPTFAQLRVASLPQSFHASWRSTIIHVNLRVGSGRAVKSERAWKPVGLGMGCWPGTRRRGAALRISSKMAPHDFIQKLATRYMEERTASQGYPIELWNPRRQAMLITDDLARTRYTFDDEGHA